jgi:hypothetical protein
MWGVVAGLMVASAAAVLIVRYMRTPRFVEVAISALRFLPDFNPATQNRLRWQLAAPLPRRLFWLRLVCLALLAAIVFVNGRTFDQPADAPLGLRIVVDGSASMTMGQPSREMLAAELADRLKVHAEANRGCAEVVTVPAIAREEDGAAARSGLSIGELVAAARHPDVDGSDCPMTQVAVISDMPRPGLALLAGEEADRVPLTWFQVGQPETNTAIRGATYVAPRAAGVGGRLTVIIDEYGSPQGAPTLTLTGPGGETITPAGEFDLSQRGTKRLEYAIAVPGAYIAELADPHGLALDDRLLIDVPAIEPLPIYVAPGLLDQEAAGVVSQFGSIVDSQQPGGVVVLPYGTGEALGASGLYLVASDYAGADRSLGYFNVDDPTLELVDLDLLERMRPADAESLPGSFIRVAIAEDADGSAWIARRGGDTPAVVLPARPQSEGGSDDETDRAWWVLFVNALRTVTGGRLDAAPVAHVDAAGAVLSGAPHESDTAVPLGQINVVADIQPGANTIVQEQQWWPYLVPVLLLLLLVERAVGLTRRAT